VYGDFRRWRPAGDIITWNDVLFPYDPALNDGRELSDTQVARAPGATQHIEESYSCDSNGAVVVRISNLSSGYQREYRLGRWTVQERRMVPGRKTKPGRRRPA